MGLVDGKAARREDGDVARASQQIAAHRQETAAVDDFLLAADWFSPSACRCFLIHGISRFSFNGANCTWPG